MMASGLVFGLVFCLLGAAALVALAFVALRYFVGEHPGGGDTESHLATADIVGVGRRPEG